MKYNPRVLIFRNLSDAEAEVRRLEISGMGEKEVGAGAKAKAIHRVVKLQNLTVASAAMVEQAMCSIGGEVLIAYERSASAECPSTLLMGTLQQYEDLVMRLRRCAFEAAQIGEEINSALRNFDGSANTIKCKGRDLQIGRRTYIMGIINVTPDSFSEDGLWGDLEKVAQRARAFASEGADLIDVGGESTRPGAAPVEIEEELKRVIPAIERIAAEVEIPISIDTYKSVVAQKALEKGASMINDTTALRGDPGMVQVAVQSGVPVVLMHMKGMPKTMQEMPVYDDVVAEIIEFFRDRIEVALAAGVKEENIIIDPGIGFGKTVEHNLEILKRLREFKVLGRTILIGTSRKSFIGKVLGLPTEERLEGTAATVAAAIMNGADIVRVHDVKAMVRVARMADAMV